VKRGLGGVHPSVSKKHSRNYLKEYDFRYNHRDWEFDFSASRRESFAAGVVAALPTGRKELDHVNGLSSCSFLAEGLGRSAVTS
jgi:hypothetical protein